MSDRATDQELSETARAIHRYLDAHPNAADSLAGILCWWLARQRYADSERAVLAALNELEIQGFISHKRFSDGTIVYQREALRKGNTHSS